MISLANGASACGANESDLANGLANGPQAPRAREPPGRPKTDRLRGTRAPGAPRASQCARGCCGPGRGGPGSASNGAAAGSPERPGSLRPSGSAGAADAGAPWRTPPEPFAPPLAQPASSCVAAKRGRRRATHDPRSARTPSGALGSAAGRTSSWRRKSPALSRLTPPTFSWFSPRASRGGHHEDV